MKVIDLQHYRIKKSIENIEQKMGLLALDPRKGAVREMKTCFAEWLKAKKIAV